MSRIRQSTLVKLHDTVLALAYDPEPHDYLLRYALEHFLEADRRSEGSEWCLDPQMIHQRLLCNPVQTDRWLRQVASMELNRPGREIETLIRVLSVGRKWITQSDHEARLQVFVQVCLESDTDSVFTSKVCRSLSAFRDTVFAWCLRPVWFEPEAERTTLRIISEAWLPTTPRDEKPHEEEVSNEESLVRPWYADFLSTNNKPKPKDYTMPDQWQVVNDRFLLGFLQSDMINIYDMLTDLWFKPDVEPELVNQLSEGSIIELDSTADIFCGGGMGAVRHRDLSIELTTGQIDILAADQNWLIAAAGRRLFVLNSKDGWPTEGRLRRHQNQLLPTRLLPEFEIEFIAVVSNRLILEVRNQGLGGSKQRMATRWWYLEDGLFRPIDDEEWHWYEYPCEELKLSIETTDEDTRLTATLWDHYGRPHRHECLLPAPIKGLEEEYTQAIGANKNGIFLFETAHDNNDNDWLDAVDRAAAHWKSDRDWWYTTVVNRYQVLLDTDDFAVIQFARGAELALAPLH